MVETKLTRHWKVKDQIDKNKMLEAKLKYDVKDRDQICSLPKKKKTMKGIRALASGVRSQSYFNI